MAGADSIIDRDEIARARALLAPRRPRDSIWAPLGAAAFLAISSLAFATAMIMAPPNVSEHVAPARGVN
jgi:hypothetical protein